MTGSPPSYLILSVATDSVSVVTIPICDEDVATDFLSVVIDLDCCTLCTVADYYDVDA